MKRLALVCCVLLFAAAVPIAALFVFGWEKADWWTISISWITAVSITGGIGFLTWRQMRISRSEELKAAVELQIDVLPPDNPEKDLFTVQYSNRGSTLLLGEVSVYVRPCEYLPPYTLIEPPASMGQVKPATGVNELIEKHILRLGPGESQRDVYAHRFVLQSMGLHMYVPHWLTFCYSYAPETADNLLTKSEDIFYLLYIPKTDNPRKGNWIVNKTWIHGEQYWIAKLASKRTGKKVSKRDFPQHLLQGNEDLYFHSFE
ncbi:hypothetical protein KAX17_00830 [Candidatus Bipolaricaulota bacterium]|nr:hypothetical protein [Candidatus Bipolaricaulota bacterium]